MSYRQINKYERYMIYKLKERGFGPREIGRYLNRSASTISRELKRNQGFVSVYWYEMANIFARQRRKQAIRPTKQNNSVLYNYILDKLRRGWSPELISGRLAREYPDDPEMRISHETIYRWVYNEAKEGGTLYRHLVRCRKKRRKRRKRLSLRGKIPGRIGIEHRPKIVEERSRFGDWESDTMVGPRGTGGGLATHVDRMSRFLIAVKLQDKRAKTYSDCTLKAFQAISKEKRKTMTVDNGSEFSDFKRIERRLRLKVYFADPYASWQRGTNENTNGLLRRYFPKGTDFTKITQEMVANVVTKLNNRPRKCLKYQTPHEVFFEQPGVALQM